MQDGMNGNSGSGGGGGDGGQTGAGEVHVPLSSYIPCYLQLSLVSGKDLTSSKININGAFPKREMLCQLFSWTL